MKLLNGINNKITAILALLLTPLSKRLKGVKLLDTLTPVTTTVFVVIFIPQMTILFNAKPQDVAGLSLLLFWGSFAGQMHMVLKKIQQEQWELVAMSLASLIPLTYCCVKLSYLKILL